MATVRESTLEQLAITTIRTLAMDAVEQAQSGHPGLPMGAAPMAYVLWADFLKHNPADPAWPDRDRFVLSAGHGSMLLYALLHLTGYDLPLEELKRFRQWGSKTPGHPEYGLTPGVETTTGPLGQGIATAVGMALAERFLAARYNRPGLPVVDHMTYVLAGDGDMMEGVSGEASSLAGHLGLGKLVVLYDDNHVSIEGATDLAFTEDVLARYAAYGWHTQRVADGNDLDAIRTALEAARTVTDRPSIIAVRTHIGYGSPHKQDSASSHGAPLGQEEVKLTKEAYGWPVEPAFYVPEEVRSFMAEARETGARRQSEWTALWDRYRSLYPAEAAELARTWEHTLPAGWDRDLPQFEAGKKLATRSASGQVLNALAQRIPTLIGGSADLAPSNNTLLKGEADQSPAHPEGRNLHFGVREHAMGAMLNGLSLHGLRVYGGTFLVFANYMRPAIRLAALMHQPVTYVFTHDSIGLGEDGPTHQPIEHLAALRAMPNLIVIRPADANETREAWKVAIASTRSPVALALSRQNLPVVTTGVPAVDKGAYILREASGSGLPDLILLATGSEVALALDAAGLLEQEGVRTRVVSFPSWELFEQQPAAYRESVLPPAVEARIAIEAASPLGWERYVGNRGRVIGMEGFGASAPYEVLFREFGFTPEHVLEVYREMQG